MIVDMDPAETDEEITDSDKQLSMVDEALVAGTIANTNGLLVILAKLVARGVFDRAVPSIDRADRADDVAAGDEPLLDQRADDARALVLAARRHEDDDGIDGLVDDLALGRHALARAAAYA